MNNTEIVNFKDIERKINENELVEKYSNILDYGEPYYNFTINLRNKGELTLTFNNIKLEYLTSMNKDYILKMFCIFLWDEVDLYDKIYFDGNPFLVTGLSKKKVSLIALYE